jgi:predicted enzyme related to lactoylglutathione lyase
MSRVAHFEVHADDPERAMRFYERVFGWKFSAWGPQEYWLITTGPDTQPGINGGMVRRRGAIDGNAVTAFVCTVDVPYLDPVLKTALAEGATMALEKQAIRGVGWLAYIKDTEGNILGIMQNDPSAK